MATTPGHHNVAIIFRDTDETATTAEQPRHPSREGLNMEHAHDPTRPGHDVAVAGNLHTGEQEQFVQAQVPIIVVYPTSTAPVSQMIPQGTTPFKLLSAEISMGAVPKGSFATDQIGQVLPLFQALKPHQQVHFHHQSPKYDCPIQDPDQSAPKFLPDAIQSRITLLLHQGPWVAADEMNFYLHQVTTCSQVSIAPVLAFPV